jgi:hypothetical protein
MPKYFIRAEVVDVPRESRDEYETFHQEMMDKYLFKELDGSELPDGCYIGEANSLADAISKTELAGAAAFPGNKIRVVAVLLTEKPECIKKNYDTKKNTPIKDSISRVLKVAKKM